MDSTVAQTAQEGNLYAPIDYWEVFNFMSYSHAKVGFDEKNVINIKGYNDSGKSAMLIALRILFFNYKPSKHIAYIKDDCDYFRIIVHFTDGVSILRDKYINGQSLYEMYKDDTVIFSTRQGNALTKINKVPEPIEQYLGLISFDDGYLNARACIEKQLLAQTSGSENYKLLNVILKSEELATASKLINEDKNKLLQDINSTSSRLQSLRDLISISLNVTGELISSTEELDNVCDSLTSRESELVSTANGLTNLQSIIIYPELTAVDSERVTILSQLSSIYSELCSIPKLPELSSVDVERLSLLASMIAQEHELRGISVPPTLSIIDTSRIEELEDYLSRLVALNEINNSILSTDTQLKQLTSELDSLSNQLKESGAKVVKCPNCGEVFQYA